MLSTPTRQGGQRSHQWGRAEAPGSNSTLTDSWVRSFPQADSWICPLLPGVMGDQDMATFDDADWSEDSCMDECDPGALLANQGLALIGMLIIHMLPLHTSFVYKSFLMIMRIVGNLTMV